ncbi:MAG: hypothetical protein EXS12_09205 [Phycisphaerales bacterium]|nr:hypothetical protein [Phycisphaerales bacterium]
MKQLQPLFITALLVSLAGCYAPDGGFMPSSGRGYTYISTSMQPLTISVVDVRTEEAFFSMDIPPGQQLTFNFLEGGGDDPIYTPDRMVYAVWVAGEQNGKLDNQLTCPPAADRRIDFDIRPGPVWPEPDAAVRLRTDEAADRPPYATTQGGKIPQKSTLPNDN